jgi:hypothetical protein
VRARRLPVSLFFLLTKMNLFSILNASRGKYSMKSGVNHYSFGYSIMGMRESRHTVGFRRILF